MHSSWDSDGRNLLVITTRRRASFTKSFSGLAVMHWAVRRERRSAILLFHARQIAWRIEGFMVVDGSRMIPKEEVWMGRIPSSKNLKPGSLQLQPLLLSVHVLRNLPIALVLLPHHVYMHANKHCSTTGHGHQPTLRVAPVRYLSLLLWAFCLSVSDRNAEKQNQQPTIYQAINQSSNLFNSCGVSFFLLTNRPVSSSYSIQ